MAVQLQINENELDNPNYLESKILELEDIVEIEKE